MLTTHVENIGYTMNSNVLQISSFEVHVFFSITHKQPFYVEKEFVPIYLMLNINNFVRICLYVPINTFHMFSSFEAALFINFYLQEGLYSITMTLFTFALVQRF